MEKGAQRLADVVVRDGGEVAGGVAARRVAPEDRRREVPLRIAVAREAHPVEALRERRGQQRRAHVGVRSGVGPRRIVSRSRDGHARTSGGR